MFVLCCFYVADVAAENPPPVMYTIGNIAEGISGTMGSIDKLLTGSSYVVGFGILASSFFKFKQHKENPQQAPLSTCVVLLMIGICLVFLPSVISVGGSTIFGTEKKEGSVKGTYNGGEPNKS